MKTIKIAFVIDDLGLGGAQRQLLELVKRIDRNRFTPLVVGLSEEKIALKKEFEKTGVPIMLIRQRGKFSFSVLFKLCRIFRQFSPTIVHTYLFTADFYGKISAKCSGVPILMSSVRSIEPDKKKHYILVDRLLGKWCDAVVANAYCIQELLSKRERINSKITYTIHNGVDLQRFPYPAQNGHLRQSMGIQSRAILLGTIGRLGPEKNHKMLLSTIAELRKRGHDVVLFIVGDGKLRSNLQQQTKELHIESSVYFLGPRDDVPDILSNLDLFILPSRYEGCPNVVLEAMAAGKCVVATAVGGTPETIVDGKTGILVKPDNQEALVTAIVDLLKSPDKPSILGQQARESIERSFTIEKMVQQTTNLYEQLLNKKGIV